MTWLNLQWKVTSKIYDFDGPRDEHGNVVIRPRTVSEYPENDHAKWQELIEQIDSASAELQKMREFAITMWNEVREEELDRLHPEQKVNES